MRRATHKFDLKKQGILRKYRSGYRLMARSIDKSPLHKMAMAEIVLEKGGFREPHWHPNANELTYCAEGKVLITLFSPHNQHDTFTLSAGEVVYLPKGYIHHLENIHSGRSRLILAYDHPTPEDLDLSESVGSMSTHVLASTFSSDPHPFASLKKRTEDRFIAKRTGPARSASSKNSHKFNIERIKPQIQSDGGLARIVNQKNFPILDHLALFSLRIAKKGVREPHWHPNATELNFVLKGKARLTILSPGGDIDTFDLSTGQGSIIPAGYFHHIENTGTTELHMTVFFNNPIPNDIGLSGALSAYSPQILASLFSSDPSFFEKLPHFDKDRMIVSGGG